MFLPSTRPSARAALTAAVLTGLFASPAAAADPVTWRPDYNTARREATEKGFPVFIVVGTDECFYCRKLEAGPLRDPAVAGLLASSFVALKVDANREPALAKALRVQVYPTVVLAGADGKIHGFLEGFQDADRLVEHMKRAVTVSTTADWAARDFNEASKSIAAGDYPRAVSLLKGIVKDAGEKPVGVKAREILDGVERQAEGRLARAKDLDARGFGLEAMDTLAELMKTYAGTRAAADAATLMAGLAEKPETQERQKVRKARDLLAGAKDDFRAGRFYECLQKCEQLTLAFAELPEGKEAATLAGEVKNNPDRLAAACEQMNERTAAMYMTLAESWLKKGQEKEALACYEKVLKLAPNSKHAELAQVKAHTIRGNNPAVPTGLMK